MEDGVEEEVVAAVVSVATRVHRGPQQDAKDTYVEEEEEEDKDNSTTGFENSTTDDC